MLDLPTPDAPQTSVTIQEGASEGALMAMIFDGRRQSRHLNMPDGGPNA
jgi:hypothetical protein